MKRFHVLNQLNALVLLLLQSVFRRLQLMLEFVVFLLQPAGAEFGRVELFPELLRLFLLVIQRLREELRKQNKKPRSQAKQKQARGVCFKAFSIQIKKKKRVSAPGKGEACPHSAASLFRSLGD